MALLCRDKTAFYIFLTLFEIYRSTKMLWRTFNTNMKLMIQIMNLK
jgi:hypothetical protein